MPPSTPLNLDLVSRSDSHIEFKWDPSISNGGSSLLGYKVYMASGSSDFSEIILAPSATNPKITSHTESSVTAGEVYRFKVSAYNVIGESL